MARIPAQAYENNMNSYRLSVMGGNEYSNDMGDDPGIQAWARQAQSYRAMYVQYLQTLSQGGIDASEQRAYQTVNGYLNQLSGWLSEYGMDGGWDPMMGGGGYGPMMGGMEGMGSMENPSVQQPQNTYEISYQDQTHRITDSGNSTDIDMALETDSRPLQVYQKENTLRSSSNRTTYTVTVVADDAVPGKHMAVVQSSDGKKIVYHNIEREGFKLNIQVPDPSQVTMDASVGEFASKIKATGLDAESEAVQGTPSDEPHLWNSHNTVDYVVPRTATEQAETDVIYTDKFNLEIENRMHSAKITKLGEHEYEIEVRDADGNVLRKIHLHQVDQINLTGVETENVRYMDVSTGPALIDGVAWEAGMDDQIRVGSQTSESTRIGNSDDSQPDDTDGARAIYNSRENNDVSVYPNFDDGITTHEITAGGQVTIGTQYNDDEVSIFRNHPPGKATIQVFKHGNRDDVETFIVDNIATKINIDGFPGKIWFMSPPMPGDPIGDITSVNDPRFANVGGSAGTPSETTEATTERAQALADVPGVSMDAAAIQTAAQTNHVELAYPPSVPNEDLFKFLLAIDPELRRLVTDFNAADLADGAPRRDRRELLYTSVRDRVVRLLQVLYPTASVSAVAGTGNERDDIMFNGQKLDLLDEDLNQTANIVPGTDLWKVFEITRVV